MSVECSQRIKKTKQVVKQTLCVVQSSVFKLEEVLVKKLSTKYSKTFALKVARTRILFLLKLCKQTGLK